MIKTTYYVIYSPDGEFEELVNNDKTSYSFEELRNGRLIVEITEKLTPTTTKVYKRSYKSTKWYKLLSATED